MKKDILESIQENTQIMWKFGWNEFNGGNITVRLTKEELEVFSDLKETHKTKLNFDASFVAGEYFLCTGTGKFFRHVQNDPKGTLSIIKIDADGRGYTQVWGDSLPTSELPSHIMSHISRKKYTNDKVIIHSHLTNLIALSFILPLTDADFSNNLWMTMPECAVLFPEGVGVVPYLTPGTVEIGTATANKMETFRIVLWAHHGAFVSHENLDRGVGLMETVEKSANITLKILTAGQKRVKPMSGHEVEEIEKRFNFTLNRSLLRLED